MLLDGIVLAAGQSSRMGAEKALLAIEGRALVAHHVERYRALCRRVVVVVRPDLSTRVRHALRELAGPQLDIIAEATDSPAASLARAIRSLNEDASVIVTPVDLLPPSSVTLARLLGAFADTALLAVTPSHNRRGGHPVLLKSELLAGYRTEESAELATLRQVLASAGDRRARIEVDDARVLGDFDTPADLPRSDAAAPAAR